MKQFYKNPKVTHKDIRKGKIFWTYPYDVIVDVYGNVDLLCIKVLEDYHTPTQNIWDVEWKPWVLVEVLSKPGLSDIHTSTTLHNNKQLILYCNDALVTSNQAPLYSTPSAAANNAAKQFWR